MDLKQYKEAWKNQPEETSKVSDVEIYKMTQAKSTSIVKWIFIIGIAEFIFWFGLNYISVKSGLLEPYEKFNLEHFFVYSNYLHTAVVILFLFLFYRNYSSISIIDDTKTLMNKILKTRKTVKWYVFYNIGIVVLMAVVLNIMLFNTPDFIHEMYEIDLEQTSLSHQQLTWVFIVSQFIVILIMAVFMWLFYYLLYGLLLKKLNKNYADLNRLHGE